MNLLPKLNRGGYISIAVIVFLLVFSAAIYPWVFPKPEEHPCQVGEAPSYYQEIKNIPAIKNMEDPPRFYQDPNPDIGGPDPVKKSDFVLIRKNVPTSKKSTPPGWDFLGETEKTDTDHTVNVGELPEKPGYDAYYPAEWGEMDLPGKGRLYIRGMGLLLFANNDPGTIIQQGDNTIYLLDVYQDKRIYSDKTKGYKEGDLFICGVDTEVGSTFVTRPDQASAPKKEQLQLEWFLFTGTKVWGVHCKPAVYLYPEKKQLVNVKVYPKGELSYTDPPYDIERGWSVTAFPSGSIEVQNSKLKVKNYEYLYYESKLLDTEIEKPKKGWVVNYEDLADFYNQTLPKLGLNPREAKDFSDYWLKTLPKSPYYFVGLIEKSQRDYLEALMVNPNPDTSIRFSFYFEPIDKPISVQEPQIQRPERKGFTLVDWGGMIKLHPGTPFTCSQ